MADSILNIIINTIKRGGGDKEAVKGFKELAFVFKDVTGLSLGSATAIGVVTGALGKMGYFIKSSVNDWVEYGTQIDNYARLLGLSTEETSRLLQATDDLFISESTLTSGLQAATRKGIDVSVEGLKKLSEQYLSMPEGIKRSKFVLDTFGRSGAEMGKLMEVGAEGIQEAMDAIDDSMIITEGSMRQLIYYKQSVDNLQDSWQGMKYTVAQEVVPELDLLIRSLSKGTDEVEAQMHAENLLENQISKLAGAAAMGSQKAKDKIAELEVELEDLRAGYAASSDAILDFQEEQAGLTETLSDYKTIMAGGFSAENEKFYESLGDLNDEAGELKQKIEDLEGKTWLTDEQKQELADTRVELGLNRQAVNELKSEHEIAMKTMAMNMIITKAASDGLTTTEVTNIGSIMTAWGLWDEKTAAVVENINGINLDDANAELGSVRSELEAIMGMPSIKRVTVITSYIENGVPTSYTQGGGAIGIGTNDDGSNKRGPSGANGLDFIVPAGYDNDSFQFWAQSGERVQVTPPGQASGRNHISIYVSGAGDPDAVANRVMQKLRLQGVGA